MHLQQHTIPINYAINSQSLCMQSVKSLHSSQVIAITRCHMKMIHLNKDTCNNNFELQDMNTANELTHPS